MKQTILVSYNQICVFDPNLDEPFNDWSDAHVQQGFSWRSGSVSFGAIENVETEIEVVQSASLLLDLNSIRAIIVPFTVQAEGNVVIGSVGDEREVEIDPGIYELMYELGGHGDSQWCRLSFIPNQQPLARILKADPEIVKTTDLLMDAQPAV